MTTATAPNYNIESAASYGNLCRVAIDFYVSTGNPAEADYAYLNARWAARLALAELNRVDISARVMERVTDGMDIIDALKSVCGDATVDAMVDRLYHELRAKAVR